MIVTIGAYQLLCYSTIRVVYDRLILFSVFLFLYTSLRPGYKYVGIVDASYDSQGGTLIKVRFYFQINRTV